MGDMAAGKGAEEEEDLNSGVAHDLSSSVERQDPRRSGGPLTFWRLIVHFVPPPQLPNMCHVCEGDLESHSHRPVGCDEPTSHCQCRSFGARLLNGFPLATHFVQESFM